MGFFEFDKQQLDYLINEKSIEMQPLLHGITMFVYCFITLLNLFSK